ncbi:MAG: hypothetical protein K8823_168 [Cenarchaeum symbiont of Oopsacas minuta]|nr:hypothetical protein [Cenarchaeum symbiont of Oopsacas minuta]
MTENTDALAIFDTFKTKSMDLTAKAIRQRAIISALTGNVNSAEKTRTAITRRITGSKEWKNTYSGVFLDIERVLIPLGFVQEEGRMPLKRGPKALQEKGVPYYKLTRKGSIVAMALNDTSNVDAVLAECFTDMVKEEEEIKNTINMLYEISPKLVRYLFEKYVRAYCKGKFEDLLPMNSSRFSGNDEFMIILEEFLTNIPKTSKGDTTKIHNVIRQLLDQAIH